AGPFLDAAGQFDGKENFPFLDATVQLKENLAFLLRFARGGDATPFRSGISPYIGFTYGTSPSNPSYVYSGFFFLDYSYDVFFMNESEPFQQNNLWRNWVFNDTDISTAYPPGVGVPNTGVDGSGNSISNLK